MKKTRSVIKLKKIFKYFDQVKFEENIPQPKKILESFNYEEIYKNIPWGTHLKFTAYLNNWYQVVHEYNKSFKFYKWARSVEIIAKQHFKEDYEFYIFYYGQPLIECSIVSWSSTWDKMLLFIISTIVIFNKKYHDRIAKLLITDKKALEDDSYKKYIISEWKTKPKIKAIKGMKFANCTKDFNALVKKIKNFRSLKDYRNTIIHGFKPPLEVKWLRAELSFDSLRFGEYVPKKYCKILDETKNALINMCEILNEGQNLVLKIIQNSKAN